MSTQLQTQAEAEQALGTPPVPATNPPAIDPLRELLCIEGALIMYVGNLESYQGIDLLLESFTQVLPAAPTTHLVAIGGNHNDIQKYKAQAKQHQIDQNVHFVGPRPIAHLKHYLAQADILVSPRIQGDNTPMKLYSYLDSGKALLATNLTTHTQVLETDRYPEMAYLAQPEAADFAAGLLHLINHPDLRDRLGQAAQGYIEQEHTYAAFSRKINSLYDWLQQELT